MIYIVVALYIEAKFLIEKYNLKKDISSQKFQIFYNEKIKLIITGTGKVKSAIALTYFLENNKKKESDFIINLGFCASTISENNLLDIVMISKIKSAYSKQTYYPDMLYKHNFLEGTLICYDKIIEKFSESEKAYIDMESLGFYEAASQYFKKDKIIVLKIISDILEKEKDKREVSNLKDSLLIKPYEQIFEFLNKLEEFSMIDVSELDEKEKNLIEKIRQNLKLSDTMFYEFKNLMRYLKLSPEIDIFKFLKIYENIEINTKLEGKKYFEEIKRKLID